jgi:hypothetical protein
MSKTFDCRYDYWKKDDAGSLINDGHEGDKRIGTYICPICLREIAFVPFREGGQPKLFSHNSKPGEKCNGSWLVLPD